jgi:hypothetical protein
MAKKPVTPKLADVVNSPEYKGMSDSIKQQIENALLESKGKPPLPKTSKKAISAEEVLANPAMVKTIKEKIGEEAAEDFIKKADEKSKIDDTDKPIVVDKQNKVRKTKQKTRKQQELEQQENTQRSLKDIILGKGSKAFNKMFPMLGALIGGVYRGGDRSANNNTTVQTNTSSNMSGTTAILSSIVDSQKTSIDILQQILTAIKATPRTPPPTTGQNQTPPPPASNQNQTPPASTQTQRSQSGQNQTPPPPASNQNQTPSPRQTPPASNQNQRSSTTPPVTGPRAQMNLGTAAATVAGGAAIAGAGYAAQRAATGGGRNTEGIIGTYAEQAAYGASRPYATTELTDRQKDLIERFLRSRQQQDDDEIRTIAENLVKGTSFGNGSSVDRGSESMREQADMSSLSSAVDLEQLRRSGNSNGLLIAHKLVLPGRPLTRNQMSIIESVGNQRVNRYPAFVIEQYNRQKSGDATPESAATPAPAAATATSTATSVTAPAATNGTAIAQSSTNEAAPNTQPSPAPVSRSGVRMGREIGESSRTDTPPSITATTSETQTAPAPIATPIAPQPAPAIPAPNATVAPTPQSTTTPATPVTQVRSTENVNLQAFREKDPEGFQEFTNFVRNRQREIVREEIQKIPANADPVSASMYRTSIESQARSVAQQEGIERFKDRLNAAGARSSQTSINGNPVTGPDATPVTSTNTTTVSTQPSGSIRMGREISESSRIETPSPVTPIAPQPTPAISKPNATVVPTPSAPTTPYYTEEAAAGIARPYINPEYAEEAAAAGATPITTPIAQQPNISGNSSSIDYDRLFNLLFHGRLSTSVNSTPIAPQAASATTVPYYAEEAAASATRPYINPEYSEEAAAGATRPYINPETPIYDRGEPTPEIPNTENLISFYQEITNRYQNLIDLLNDQGDFAINILAMDARYTANRNFLSRISTGNNTYDTSIIQRIIANLGNIESRRLELLNKISIAFGNCLRFRAQLARLQSFNFMPSDINSRIESDNKQLETFISDYNKLLSDFNSIEENNGREDATPVPSPIPDSQIYDRGEPTPPATPATSAAPEITATTPLIPIPAGVPIFDIDVRANRIQSTTNRARATQSTRREGLTANQLNGMAIDAIANRDATKSETVNATAARRRIRQIMDHKGDDSGVSGKDGDSNGDAVPKSASQEAAEEDLRENRILNFKADEIFFKADKFEFEGVEEDEQDASKTTSNNAGGGGADATPAPNTASTGGGTGGGGSSSAAGSGANPPVASTGGGVGNTTGGGGTDAAPAPAGDTGGEGINGATTGGGASSTITTGDAAQPSNPAATAGLNFRDGVDKRITPAIANKVKDVQSGFGKGLLITSGFRDAARNRNARGAANSVHMSGNAVDVTFPGNQEDTINFIKAASAKGLGGIGVYRPGFVHIDTGAKRVWGPDYSAGSIPAFAKAALNDHMTGQTTATPAGSSPTSGATVAEASAQNDMSIRSPSSTPPVQPSNSESASQAAPSESSSNPIDPNNPGPLEPSDAGLRYARLFSMAA